MSLIGFTPRNHPQQAVRDSVDDRHTPDSLWLPLHAEHRFTLDAAASEANTKCEKFYTRDTDGLLWPWTGERVWCNPPFSNLEAWVAKAWHEMRNGCEAVVMLLPANRCEQGFWQRHVEPFRDGAPVDGIWLRTRFVKGRTAFGNCKQGYTKSPPFGCVLLTFSKGSPSGQQGAA